MSAMPASVEDDDPVPDDMDEFRYALARKISTFMGMPRRCREPVCRRTKRCAGATFRCQRDYPAPQFSPEREARMKAALKRALQRLRVGE